MRYSFESFRKNSLRPHDITTRVEDLPKDAFNDGGYVVITDMLKSKGNMKVTSLDDLHEIYEQLCMAEQWKDRPKAVKWNPLEETDGFHVKVNEGDTVDRLHKAGHSLPDDNPKTAAAAKKPRMAAVPPIAIMALGTAMQTGADKYGLFNWRDTNVTATVFYNAMLRHLEQWYSGEQHASDTGVHHLAHLMAGAAIILDAEMNNVFIDDRPKGQTLGDDYSKYFIRKAD